MRVLVFLGPGVDDLPLRHLANSPGDVVACELVCLHLDHVLVEVLLVIELVLVVLRVLRLVYEVALAPLNCLRGLRMVLKWLAQTRRHRVIATPHFVHVELVHVLHRLIHGLDLILREVGDHSQRGYLRTNILSLRRNLMNAGLRVLSFSQALNLNCSISRLVLLVF